ncbi:hypothetical protein MG293_003327 [Ovis ammon polii]|uniref:Uncharacterized protein n=1 Tax=Ovis ammon polii TaxID=230172 RepID=A0AAD4ULD4_OVIAM|nr:hypothetical protein MG293_003327 [Ovis ammon polii]
MTPGIPTSRRDAQPTRRTQSWAVKPRLASQLSAVRLRLWLRGEMLFPLSDSQTPQKPGRRLPSGDWTLGPSSHRDH